jgi:glucan biosynthesis protein C
MNTQTSQISIQTGVQVQPVSVTKTAPTIAEHPVRTTRLAYLDHIRVLMCALVIMVHTSVTYGSIGGWMFYDRTANNELTAILLSFFVIICQSFFMGLFFFISGYVTPASIDRKGLATFWKDRILRLALPLAVFTLLLSKVPAYLEMIRNHGLSMSFLEFCRVYFWRSADAGPTWFLFALLVFNLGYSLWRLAVRALHLNVSNIKLPVPGKLALFGFATVMGASMLAVAQFWPTTKEYRLFDSITLMLAFFPQYLLMFPAGILAYRNDWLNRLPAGSLKMWAILAGVMVVAVFPLFALGGALDGNTDVFFSGLSWQSAATNLWIALACVSISMTLILWLRGRSQRQGQVMKAVSASTFAAYLIHPLVLVPITFGLSFVVFHPLAKWTLVSALAVSGSFAVAIVLRRIPGLKAIL